MTTSRKIVFNKESTWSEISTRFCRFHGLPYGSSLKVVYASNSKYPKGRVQRNNTVYRRATFRKATLAQALDDENVAYLIDNHLLPYIDINLRELGAEIGAFSPEGDRLDRRTYLRTWRSLPPLPTEDEIEAENAREREIDEIADEVRKLISSISEFRWDPEDTIPQAVLRALIRTYGATLVQKAMTDEA